MGARISEAARVSDKSALAKVIVSSREPETTSNRAGSSDPGTISQSVRQSVPGSRRQGER